MQFPTGNLYYQNRRMIIHSIQCVFFFFSFSSQIIFFSKFFFPFPFYFFFQSSKVDQCYFFCKKWKRWTRDKFKSQRFYLRFLSVLLRSWTIEEIQANNNVNNVETTTGYIFLLFIFFKVCIDLIEIGPINGTELLLSPYCPRNGSKSWVSSWMILVRFQVLCQVFVFIENL